MREKNVKKIIFDLDGTLFQSELLAIPAFHDTISRLKSEGYYSGPLPDNMTLMAQFGKTNEEIWNELLPEVTDEVKKRADEYMLYYELVRLKNGEGRPYPGVTDTLKVLKQWGLSLYIASNGREEYVSSVCTHHFSGFFEGVYCAGGYKTGSKVDLVKIIKTNHQGELFVMVGDRLSDVEAGKKNQMVTIGCKYGFGEEEELLEADYIIDDFRDLLDILA